MTSLRTTRLILCLGLMGAGFIPAAWADVWNKKTTVTFPEAVSVPGAVLQPGRYVMQLADSLSNRHIVQIRNEEESHVYATILAIPKYRPEPAEKTILTFYEAPVGEPRGLRSWFYPGDTIGQEFPRAKNRVQLAALTTPTLNARDQAAPTADDRAAPTGPMPEDSQDAAAVEPQQPKQEPAAEPKAEAETPKPAEEAVEQKPAEEKEATKGDMPETASPLPLMVLIGFSALATATALGIATRRVS